MFVVLSSHNDGLFSDMVIYLNDVDYSSRFKSATDFQANAGGLYLTKKEDTGALSISSSDRQSIFFFLKLNTFYGTLISIESENILLNSICLYSRIRAK